MKASVELNPSSKPYLFFQRFNNATGSLLVVYTHLIIIDHSDNITAILDVLNQVPASLCQS